MADNKLTRSGDRSKDRESMIYFFSFRPHVIETLVVIVLLLIVAMFVHLRVAQGHMLVPVD